MRFAVFVKIRPVVRFACSLERNALVFSGVAIRWCCVAAETLHGRLTHKIGDCLASVNSLKAFPL